jgi:hypothetical protein
MLRKLQLLPGDAERGPGNHLPSHRNALLVEQDAEQYHR